MSTVTLARAPTHTAESAHRELDTTLDRLSRCASSNALVATQLANLHREWDSERTLEAWFGSAVLMGIALAATRDRRWLALPAVAAGFMLQHAVQGSSPPLSLLRRLGFRTRADVTRERYALKGIRGDFAGLGLDRGAGCARRAYDAARPR